MHSRPTDSETGTDRRRHPRRRVMWIGKIVSGEAAQPCVILDLSSGGAKIHLPFPFALGRRALTLLSPHIGPVASEIVWRDRNFAGLRFT